MAGIALREGPTPGQDGVVVAFQGTADSVELQIMEDRFPSVEPLIEDGGVWFGKIPVDRDGSVEYRLAITTGDRRRTIIDPTNPVVARNPFGRNSVATGPSYEAPLWLETSIDEPGTLENTTIASRVWERDREHLLYLPPAFEPGESTRLLIMHDGPEYVEYAGLAHCLDVLIATGGLPPMIVLLHQPGRRNQEYAGSERHLIHVFDEILPELIARYRIGSIAAGGASLGGVASLSLAVHRPEVIDGLLLQSASMVTSLGGPFQRGPVFKPFIPLIEEILSDPSQLPPNVVMSCGTYDGLVEDHRRHLPVLQAGIPDLGYEEINAGHHWRCWRDRLAPDLTAAFSGVT